MHRKIKALIENELAVLGLSAPGFSIERPAEQKNGDFATNVALVAAKGAKMNPRALAEKIAAEIRNDGPETIEKIEVAGPGFINFYLSRDYFTRTIRDIEKQGRKYGRSDLKKGQKILVEYTDPNAFKEFHIGHLMSNTIGESLARLIEAEGAKVVRMCYQSDVGLNVAKALWGVKRNLDKLPSKRAPLSSRTAYLGACYVEGSNAYEDDPEAKKEIDALNKIIYLKEDKELMKLYKLGRKWSLEKFEELYRILGTRFDYYVLESEVVEEGVRTVTKNIENGIFEKSDGAIVFKGEKHDPRLHTRVFINSQGIPTYEAKDIGLNTKKWNKVRPDKSLIITANEQTEYFRVVFKALELIHPESVGTTEHIPHGFMRLASGKMSSRKGNVITGESIILDVEKLVAEKLKDRTMPEKEKARVAEIVAIAAIKFSILRQVTSSDIIFDFEKSISFEGDSGPYLLYTAVRAGSILEKAKKERVKPRLDVVPPVPTELERLLASYAETVVRAGQERAPHHLVTYLTNLASAFNAWYANTLIVRKDDPESPYRVALTAAVRKVFENGLDLLGMQIPERM